MNALRRLAARRPAWIDRGPDPAYFTARSFRDGKTFMAPDVGEIVQVTLNDLAAAVRDQTAGTTRSDCLQRLSSLSRGGHRDLTGDVLASCYRPAADCDQQLIQAWHVTLPDDELRVDFEDLPIAEGVGLTLTAAVCSLPSIGLNIASFGPAVKDPWPW